MSVPWAPLTNAVIAQVIELLRPTDAGKLLSVLSWECFGLIRSLVPFRLPGAQQDYIIVGSDSGRIDILQFDGAKNAFKKVHEETFGKSGCRRLVVRAHGVL